MPTEPFVPLMYGAGPNRSEVGTSSADAPIAMIVFEYDGTTSLHTSGVGAPFRGISILFSVGIKDGTFYSVESISNGAGDVTITFQGGPTITRAVGVDYDGDAIACTPSTNTIDVVWPSGKKAVLAVWG